MAKHRSLADLAAEAARKDTEAPGPDSAAEAVRARLGAREEAERPPKPVRLNVDVDPDLYAEVKAKADRQGRKLSAVVRELLKVYLELE